MKFIGFAPFRYLVSPFFTLDAIRETNRGFANDMEWLKTSINMIKQDINDKTEKSIKLSIKDKALYELGLMDIDQNSKKAVAEMLESVTK